MSITYQCEQCGQWLTVREGKVGSRAKCDVCGHAMVVPDAPDPFGDTPDGPRGGAAPPEWRARASAPTKATTTTFRAARPSPRPPEDEGSGKLWGGGLGILGFVLFLVIRLALQGGMGRPARRPRAAAPPPRAVVVQRVDLDAPVELPRSFPDPGPPRRIEPGVDFREIHLVADRPSTPGHSGKLWLFTPASDAPPAPGSMPCVLFAPAGSRWLTGMKLAGGDLPEILPYVRAGFAVLAFELDGADPFPDNRPHVPPMGAMIAFLRARGGIADGEVARAFLKAKVPEVDQGRLYVAGHSSAATFALLFAEHAPYLKGCVAYAPAVDLAARFDAARQDRLRRMGLGDLIDRLSPRAGEDKLSCPVFLFHARGDGHVPYEDTEAFADRLRARGKRVTLDLVDDGDHIDSMLKDGLPRGVAWLKARDAEVRAGR